MRYFIYFAVIIGIAACKSGPPPDITDPGQIIYLGYKDTYASCARCHGKEGQGNDKLPEIKNAIRKLGREKVRSVILKGKGIGDDAMPGFADDFAPREVEQILDFLTRWPVLDSLQRVAKDSATSNGTF